MKYFFTKIQLLLVVVMQTVLCAYGAEMYIESPESVSSNRSPFILSVFLDPESTPISGISGDLSFPSELFDVELISTQNGVIPLWIQSPSVSVDKKFDRRTHIVFEGIVPGGFSGVHSPYAIGVYPGSIFTVTLIPKNKGNGEIRLDNTELHAYDEKATVITTKNILKQVVVPTLSGSPYDGQNNLKFVVSDTVSMEVVSDSLVHTGNPYVYINDENPSHAIDYIQIVETSEYNPKLVSSYAWRTVTNPYVLLDPSRSKYVHAKIIYTNKTFTYKTVAPVENLQSFSQLSRILVYIVIAIFLLYHYGKNFLHLFSKK